MRDPWRLSMEQIAALDDWQLLNVYLRPGEEDQAEDGVYWPVPVVWPELKRERKVKHGRAARFPDRRPTEVSFEGMYKMRLRDFGMFTESQIEARWQRYLEKEPGAAEG